METFSQTSTEVHANPILLYRELSKAEEIVAGKS